MCAFIFVLAGKSGCHPNECVDLARHIIDHCDKLSFCGLMTIGQFDYDYSQGPNPDFQVSRKLCVSQTLPTMFVIYLVLHVHEPSSVECFKNCPTWLTVQIDC